MSEGGSAENGAALSALQRAERQVSDPLLADVFRVAAMNVWAFGAPCDGECDDLHCEYARPILTLATSVLPPGDAVCHEFVGTGHCGHSDAEHDALADASIPPATTAHPTQRDQRDQGDGE